MNIQEDFEEFLRLLTAQAVEFVIVGGYAVAFHGYVRATQYMDIFFRNSNENRHQLLHVLREFGLPVDDSILHDLADPGSIVRIGVPPVRIEMINTISGLSFEDVWGRRVGGCYGAVPIDYISYDDLPVNKRASGRPKDLADFDELGGNRARNE